MLSEKLTAKLFWCSYILIILLVAAAAVLLSSCSRSPEGRRDEKRFVAIEYYKDCTVLTDTYTGISYVMYDGCICPLYDKEGNLYRANGWRDY